MKRTPIRKIRRKARPGRLKGRYLENLRLQCFLRDGWRCVQCHQAVADWLDDLHDKKSHMAHIQAKRRGGDSLPNVRTLCGKCHRREHNWGKSMVKPCPKKEAA